MLVTPNDPTRDVLLRLSGGEDDSGRAAEALGLCTHHALMLAELPARIRSPASGRRPRQVVVVGAPPEVEIGWSLTLGAIAAIRPRRVVLLDRATGTARRRSLRRHLAVEAASAATQVLASAASLVAQRVLTSAVRRWTPKTRRGPPRASRVLYLRPMVGVSPGIGGSTTHAHEVIRALGDAGLTVEPWTTDPLIAQTAAAEPDPPCVWNTVRVPRAFKAVPASTAVGGDLALLVETVRRARAADVLYQRHARFSIAGALVAMLARRPLLLEYNSPADLLRATPSPMARRRALCERAALAAAARVVVVSDVAARMVAEQGVPPERILVNPNGVDVARFDRGGGPEVRRRLGLRPEHLVAGFVGTFGPWHGAPVLARAFVDAAAGRADLRLLLIGDGDERAAVEALIAAGGAGHRTVFAGKVAPSAIPAHLDACDILVAPTVPLPGAVEFFGSPTKLFEYMAAGKAIVASGVGQVADVISHERSGLLVDAGDVAELADALRRLAGDPALRERLGAQASRDARAGHGWDRNAERILRAYGELAT